MYTAVLWYTACNKVGDHIYNTAISCRSNCRNLCI